MHTKKLLQNGIINIIEMSRIFLFFVVLLVYNICASQKIGEWKQKKYFLIVITTFFVLESALRHMSVGSDTYQYYSIFEQVKLRTFDYLVDSFMGKGEPIKDPFYWIFQKGFQVFFPKFRLFLFFVAIFFFVSFNRFLLCNHLSLRGMMISYLFYLGMFHPFYSYTGIRQTIAVALIFHSSIHLFDGKYVRSLFWFVLAFFFHGSAIVFAMSYFFKYIKSPKVLIPLIVVAMTSFIVFREQIMLYMLLKFGLDDRFENFATAATEGAGSLTVASMYLFLFILLLFFIKIIMKDSRLLYYFKYYCFVISCLPIMYADNSSFRIAYYHAISMFVLVPFLISQVKIKQKYSLVYLLFFVLLLYSAAQTPYCFYWQSAPLIEYGILSFKEPLFF